MGGGVGSGLGRGLTVDDTEAVALERAGHGRRIAAADAQLDSDSVVKRIVRADNGGRQIEVEQMTVAVFDSSGNSSGAVVRSATSNSEPARLFDGRKEAGKNGLRLKISVVWCHRRLILGGILRNFAVEKRRF